MVIPTSAIAHRSCRLEQAVIIGHGNVALDVAGMLAKTPDELRHTDIAAHAWMRWRPAMFGRSI
jgi:hypothetical protein